jgi:hypothetical protein
MSFHNAESGYSVHVSNAFTFANAAARNSASVVSADVGKIALESDTNRYYILINTTPTWTEITSGVPGSSSGVGAVTSTAIAASVPTPGLYIATGSGSFTFTLPTAVGNTGLVWYFNSVTNTGTILLASISGQTLDGINITSSPVHFSSPLVITSDGSNWFSI